MRICVVTPGYPYKDYSFFTFVRELCCAWADQGMNVTVISPVSITKSLMRRAPWIPYCRNDKTLKGNQIRVYSPKVISLSKLGKNRILSKILRSVYIKAVENVITGLANKPDILYTHFWTSCDASLESSIKYEIPLFVATGESVIAYSPDSERLKLLRENLKGVVCVSSKNKYESLEKGLITDTPTTVIPNAINSALFHEMDKAECRSKLGILDKEFVICFVGYFIDRKGPERLATAVKKIGNPDIKTIFIGSRPGDKNYHIDCDGKIFEGSLEHNQIPLYLNASDLFVLPTLKEGCCNAIIEAMACGLPIVSSNRDFNKDILDETNAILVDPLNVDEIADAIKQVYNSKEIQQSMRESSLTKARNLEIGKRSTRILEFMQENL